MTEMPVEGAALQPEPVLLPTGAGEQEGRPKALFFFLLLYLIFDYGRPQDLVPALGVIRPAAIATVLLAVAYLFMPRRWVRGNGQFHAVWAFVALLAVWVPLARNNFFAYWTAYSMVLLLPFVLSVPVCLNSLSAVRGMFAFCVLLMAYQAGWAVTHGGRGTGATLYDENDVALYINTFLPFAYLLLGLKHGGAGSCSTASPCWWASRLSSRRCRGAGSSACWPWEPPSGSSARRRSGRWSS